MRRIYSNCADDDNDEEDADVDDDDHDDDVDYDADEASVKTVVKFGWAMTLCSSIVVHGRGRFNGRTLVQWPTRPSVYVTCVAAVIVKYFNFTLNIYIVV